MTEQTVSYQKEGHATMVMHLPRANVHPSKTNPRKHFSPEDQQNLQASITEKGIEYPLLVRPSGSPNSWEIVDGERRWLVAGLLKLETVPCLVKLMTDEQAVDAQLVSHLQRTNITAIETAEAYKAHMTAHRAARAALAQKIGVKISDVAERLQLLSMTKEARAALNKGLITIDHATLLSKMTEDDQERALEFLLEFQGEAIVQLSVFKKWISEEISFNLSNAPWDKADAELIPGVPACTACPKNSAFNTALFSEDQGKGICQDRVCFKAKLEAYKNMMHAKARKEEKRPFILISTDHNMRTDDPLKIRDVKMSGRFKVVKAGNECEDTKKAQWIDGPNKGKITQVCNYSKCKKHWKGEGRSAPVSRDEYNSPANVLKRKRAEHDRDYTRTVEFEFRQSVVSEVIKKLPNKVTLDLFRSCLSGFLDRFSLENEDMFVRQLGLDGRKFDQDDLIEYMKTAPEAQAVRAWHLLNFDGMFDVFDMEGSRTKVSSLVKQYKLDGKKIRSDAEKKIQNTLHQCEVCHCHEEDPCDGGCSWDK